MRHRVAKKKLNRNTAHRKALYRNLITDLFRYERIQTTEAKAKAIRPYAEKLITLARRGDLHARRQVLKWVREKEVVDHLFYAIAPSFEDRPGGYTRIIKLGRRQGDAARVAIIELVEGED
ncbi:MAG: 50S ribosomal protein L17 [Anaerolineae bacterium]